MTTLSVLVFYRILLFCARRLITTGSSTRLTCYQTAERRSRCPSLLLIALHLGDDLFAHRPRRLFILLELHREVRSSLRRSTHCRRIAAHVRQRNRRLDGLHTADHLHALDASAPRVQVADDRAHVLLRHRHLNRHHRLQQHRLCLLPCPPLSPPRRAR